MNGTPTPASLQEPELMRRVAQQDKDAFSGLYDRYSQLAFNLAWRVLNERQEAEDVVQEVFLQVWREAASFDMKRGNLSTWIATITRSRAIDKLRSRKARRIYNAGNEDSGEVVERLPEVGMGRDYLDNRILVNKAFASLSGEQRTALEMAYYEGMSQSEIAEALREPLGTVKTRIRSGLTRLREVLQPRLGSRLL
jgi:RNA polymerase sigma-70 factor (ECF subfamily)